MSLEVCPQSSESAGVGLFDKERAVISIAELSRFLGVPKKTIYSWFYNGKMPQPLKLGQRVMFVREDIVSWLHSSKREAK